MDPSDLFSIRQMIELTGLSEFTIRGWENRYSAFHPRRGPTGRRKYSKTDIERALLIRELLKRGHKISKIAQLNNQKLQSLFEHKERSRTQNEVLASSKLAAKALDLMALQKWTDLAEFFQKIPQKNSFELVHDFLLPVLFGLNEQINAGIVSIAQEHVFSSLLKEKIYSALSDLQKQSPRRPSKNWRFVLATPEGDYHEMGLLIAHLLVRATGLTSLYLGPHSPAQDLSETALRFEATHLLIVSTISKKQGARQDLFQYVSEVQRKMGTQVQIILAGQQAPQVSTEKKTSVYPMPSFQDFEQYLQSLNTFRRGQ